MTTQWNTRALGKGPGGNGAGGDFFNPAVLEEAVVILMQGKNTFGDSIYSYLKITNKDLMRMKTVIQGGQPFNPSDFGTIVAAGKGEPTDEVRAEISSMYKMMDMAQKPAAAANAPVTQKAWDDY